MNFRNNFTATPTKGEIQKNKVSATIPGQTLSLKELLTRYTRGQSIETFTPVYDEGYYPDTSRMDKLDKLDLARQLKTSIEDIQKRKPKADSGDPAPQDKPGDKPAEKND